MESCWNCVSDIDVDKNTVYDREGNPYCSILCLYNHDSLPFDTVIIRDVLDKEKDALEEMSIPLDSDSHINSVDYLITKGWVEALEWVLGDTLRR
jgi:hypothetical protein